MPIVDSPKIVLSSNFYNPAYMRYIIQYRGVIYNYTVTSGYTSEAYEIRYNTVSGGFTIGYNMGCTIYPDNSKLDFDWVSYDKYGGKRPPTYPTVIPENEIEFIYCNIDIKDENREIYRSADDPSVYEHKFFFYWRGGDGSFPTVVTIPSIDGEFNNAPWMIHEGESFPFFIKNRPAWYSPPLQTRKAYALIYETTDPSASMMYDGKWYKFEKYLETFPWYKGVLDEQVTQTYGGDTIEYDGVTYYFLASGIEMRGTLGGYGEYLPNTERTVMLQGDMSSNVNFYYTLEKPKSDKIILRGIATLQAYLQSFDGTTIEEITATIKSISKFLARSKRISIEPVKIELQLAPGDEIIIDSNYMIAIKNGTENVSNKLLGRFPVLMPGENIITYTDNDAERNVEITVDQKDRWH